jgi:thymidylate kinase
VLVFGSLPPAGRDLDLLVRPPEEEAIVRGLQGHGFARGGHRWVRFRECSAEVIELVPAARWRLPGEELAALFAEALPIPGSRHLARPSPPHALLIMARKLAWDGGRLDEKRRARLSDALAADPDALTEAARRAPAWGSRLALAALERAHESGRPLRRIERGRALTELSRTTGAPRARAAVASGLVPRPRRGTLVTLSGLDGAGKSSQATALRDALDRLGFSAVVEWSSLSSHPPLLHAATGVAKWLLRTLDRARSRGSAPADPVAAGPQGAADVGKALRQRSALARLVWTTLVALANARSQSRAANRHLWRGRVVVCDRYTLDSKVHLRYAYGEERKYRFQTALIRLLSPRPDRSYFLDVSAETATRRKQDYELNENLRRARLYQEEHGALGARRIEGERPPEEICAEIAEDVWSLLAGRLSG